MRTPGSRPGRGLIRFPCLVAQSRAPYDIRARACQWRALLRNDAQRTTGKKVAEVRCQPDARPRVSGRSVFAVQRSLASRRGQACTNSATTSPKSMSPAERPTMAGSSTSRWGTMCPAPCSV